MERKKITVIIIAVSILVLAILIPGYLELRKLQEEYKMLNKRIELLMQHNDVLKYEIKRLKEDPEYVEKRAREKLGIINKGEFVYEG
jgi:cell division protein FtsB